MKILLIEDDPDDVELLQDALARHGVLYQMEVIKDGNAAIKYFKTSEVYPEIIILDLNLPKVHGRDVIVEIKSGSLFQNIPLLILTTSSSKHDMEHSYKYGADKYLLKPVTLEQIKETVEAIVALANRN